MIGEAEDWSFGWFSLMPAVKETSETGKEIDMARTELARLGKV